MIYLSLSEILVGDIAHRMELLEESLLKEKKRLNGRQLLWHILQDYDEPEANTLCNEFLQLTNLQLQNDDLTTFLAEWKFCLQGMTSVPESSVLEVLYNKAAHPHDLPPRSPLPRIHQVIRKSVEDGRKV